MPTHEHMEAAAHRYLQALNQGDVEAVMGLYADDATVEDPVGSELKVGSEVIRAFYTGSLGLNLSAALEGPVRVAGCEATFPFSISYVYEGKRTIIHAIDLFRFNEAGKIVSMRAFFGPANIEAG